MSEIYTADVIWRRGEQTFTDRKYSRAHSWRFDGGTIVPASSAPGVVRPPLSREDAVDPEEGLLASVGSCHMLFFLDLAARAGFTIDSYDCTVDGVLEKGPDGKTWLTRITLKPAIVWSGAKTPTVDDIAGLHHKSHGLCFIANSLKSDIVIADVPPKFV